MALRGDYLTLTLQDDRSGLSAAVVAETTSVSVDFSAEFLETTNQTSGLNTSGIGGKVTGTASGDFLFASDGANWDALFAIMNAGTVIEFQMYVNSVLKVDCDCVLTSINATGGNSDSLTTGAWTATLSGNPAV
jgi:hypothetical protein